MGGRAPPADPQRTMRSAHYFIEPPCDMAQRRNGLSCSQDESSRVELCPPRTDRHVIIYIHTHQLLERLIMHVSFPVESGRQSLRTETI